MISVGTTVLGALFGRKAPSGTLGRAGTAARGVGRTSRSARTSSAPRRTSRPCRSELAELERRAGGRGRRPGGALRPRGEELEALGLKPRKTDVEVRVLTLAWAPKRRAGAARARPAWT